MKWKASTAIAACSLLLSAEPVLAMNKIIVATFGDSNHAYEAATAIKKLKDAGASDFKLRTGVIIAKDSNGNLSVLESRSRPLFGMAAGTATGALIRLVGGAPGAAVAASLGAMTGLSADAIVNLIDADFVKSVSAGMHPDTTAIIVEADEGSTRSVDDIVTQEGGNVYRQALK